MTDQQEIAGKARKKADTAKSVWFANCAPASILNKVDWAQVYGLQFLTKSSLPPLSCPICLK